MLVKFHSGPLLPRKQSGFFVSKKSDKDYLQTCLTLACRGKGSTSPNPMVGAVVVKGDKIVGRGFHRRAGSPHAEILALREAGRGARGATLYVNLEPCCHYGRTNPCTDAIIKAGITRVVYCHIDPNPKVKGRGDRILRRADVQVNRGLLAAEAKRLNEVYLKYISTGYPFVILKTAQTLDGRIATGSGDSKWISGIEARRLAHRLRAECDAVAVGAGTVRADNPQLTVRLCRGKNPYRIILTRQPRFARSINLFRGNNDAKTIVATTARAAATFKMRKVAVWAIRENERGLVLADFLKKAGQFGISSLLIEGGGRLATSFLKTGLVDKHYVIIAPIVIGKGIEAVGDLNIRRLKKALSYEEYLFRPCGTDLLFTGYPART